jgi:hypothetical protein
MRRAFDIDVPACPRCENQMRLLATIDDPRVVEQILTHLGLPSAPVRADPAEPPPAYTSHLFADTLARAPALRQRFEQLTPGSPGATLGPPA